MVSLELATIFCAADSYSSPLDQKGVSSSDGEPSPKRSRLEIKGKSGNSYS